MVTPPGIAGMTTSVLAGGSVLASASGTVSTGTSVASTWGVGSGGAALGAAMTGAVATGAMTGAVATGAMTGAVATGAMTVLAASKASVLTESHSAKRAT